MIKIDRQKVYESHGYKFKNFVTLTDDEKLMILGWRNHEKVRSMMVNKDIISLDSHLSFIKGLNNREDCYYWLVKDPEGRDVGVLDIMHIDEENDQGEIGYYLNQDIVVVGFLFMVECQYFVYNQLKLGNNLVTINVNNREVLLFNKYLGNTFERKEKIGDEMFYINRHANGKNILAHYDTFSFMDYARFVRDNKNKEIVFDLKG